ncbi:N-acetylglucosamine-6-phosphate deacetylase [Ruicaihuangia caeni]|uniref:N-acetylglucosamine-6-phosphate deacetylase n=1 Tax=Ruicaihuangia caeni TaxID=3042517 RepID=UPI00338F1B77
MRTVIHSGRLIRPSSDERHPEAWIVFDERGIIALGGGDDWRQHSVGDAVVVDARGLTLTAGFVDIHCHGGGGASFDNGADAIRQALSLHRAHGTTRSVLSFVTAPLEVLERRLDAAASVMADDPLVVGVHLEGPFIEHEFRGAHDPAQLRAPSAAAVQRLIDAGHGVIRQVTLAPELPGASEAIALFREAGIRVAIGHTGADFKQARAAFESGATLLTHAFNAMRGIHHREPGPVIAATEAPGVTLELINDGVHVRPEVVRLAFAGAPGRIALVTDAMAAAGSHDGDYVLGSLDVQVREGVARLRDGGAIAGSTLTMDAAVRRAIEAGVPEADAVAAATETPARAIGLDRAGRLDPGSVADVLLLDAEWNVRRVWADGRELTPAA